MGSFEEELAKGMETKLIARETENQFSLDRLAKAIDFLDAASQIFDDTGFHAESEILVSMLEKIASRGLQKARSVILGLPHAVLACSPSTE